MLRPVSTWRILLICLLVATTGCVPTQPFYLHEDGDLSHYIDKSTQMETPDLHTELLADVMQSQRPLSVAHPEFKDFWDLSLEECVAIALLNTKTIRGASAARLQNGQIFAGTSEGALVLNSVGRFVTTYDVAIVESNPGQQTGGLSNFLRNPASGSFGPSGGFGGQSTDGGVANNRFGVEAALAEFDTQLLVSSAENNPIMNSTDRPQNVRSTSPFFPTTLDLRNGGMDVTLAKRTAEGTTFAITSGTDYTSGNQRGFNFDDPASGSQPLLSIWTQTLQLEARHPLLRGRGSQINRMPIIIARMGADIEMTNVYANVQDMLNNLEIRYWDLYLAYRNLETAKVARDSALVTWRIVFDKYQQGSEPVQQEAQAQEQYYNFRAQVESSLRALYDAENELRFLMGLAATDGRLIRPKDDPTLARVEFDWCDILAESIARRPELIAKRWQVKQREMELILARNQLLPQLDVGAQYRWLGVGDELIQADRSGKRFPFVGSTAVEELTGGQFQEFSLLFQYQMPIGFRRELAGVRHAQLRLAREKATLEDMELDVAHGLSHALRNLDTNFQLAQTNSNRWAAAEREVQARQALFEGGRVALDEVLEAQRRRALAQAAFWNAVAEYNKSIADLHTRKGSIMEYDGIGFEEGCWPQKAYWDALGRARERDAAWYIDYGWTRPKVISRGAMPHGLASPSDELPSGPTVEELPAPEPTPAPPPAERPQADPLPTPRIAPFDTRTKPKPAAPRAISVNQPADETADSRVGPATATDAEPGTTRSVVAASAGPPARQQTVAPAAFFSDSSNPLRQTSRPIGTGVQ